MGLLISVVTVWAAVGMAGALPPPPPNPSDNDIASAGAAVDADTARVGTLINQVAGVEQQLQQLDSEVAQKREAVNKALVDLQNARQAADRAAAAVTSTQQDLTTAGEQLGQARGKFDTFAVQAYTQPGAGSVLSYLSGSGPDQALDRAEVISVVSTSQHDALDQLRRAQVERANKDSMARKAKQAADEAAAVAQQRKTTAENAVAAAQAAADQQAARRNDLVQQRDSAQQLLNSARQNVAGLQGQRDAYEAWDRERKIEEAEAEAAAQAAAARAATDLSARDLAAQLAAGRRPHTQLDDGPPPRQSMSSPGRPSGSPSQLIEVVVDRALSQLGVSYSWGGGNESGPTKGIHDGGVADSYHDYQKVGFDCSGLMVYAFAGVGISMPHYSGYQYQMGTRVPVDQRQRGDMLFWGPGGNEHVAMYLGDGKMVEAPESGEVVRITDVRGGAAPYAVRMIT
jgi:cell wall-associated NlpC family hydrolase